jgi:hypothetical protein
MTCGFLRQAFFTNSVKPDRPASFLHRRDAVKTFAAEGVVAAAGCDGYEYSPRLDYDLQADAVRTSYRKRSPVPEHLLEPVHSSTLAANGHNAQPWKFSIRDARIEIRPDYSRRLPVVDPDDRALWIGLGCALENLLVASRAAGYAPEALYPDGREWIGVRLTEDTPQADPLFDAVPLRQNTRGMYDGRPVDPGALDPMRNLPLEPGVTIRFLIDRNVMDIVEEYVRRGNIPQYSEKAFLEELVRWLRFNKRETMASRDGLYTRCSGNPEAPR